MAPAEEPIIYFLLVYNLTTRTLESHQGFEDIKEAMREYEKTEIELLGRGYEVVLLGAESIEALKITHGSYFEHVNEAHPQPGLSFSLS